MGNAAWPPASGSGVGPWGSDPAPLSDDLYAHELAVAQMEAATAAAERMSAAWAGLERRIDRLASSLATVEDLLPVAVSPMQLRLVAGG